MADREIDVLVAGRVFADLVFTGVHAPAPGAEVFADGFAISPGGAANRAVAAARLARTPPWPRNWETIRLAASSPEIFATRPTSTCASPSSTPDYQIPVSVAITDGHDGRSSPTSTPANYRPGPWTRRSASPTSASGADRPPPRPRGCAPRERRSSGASAGTPRDSGPEPSSATSKASTS